MSFFWESLKVALLGRVRGWRTWALLLLLPVTAFSVRGLLPARETAAPIQVGVVLPREGGEEFWRRLEERGGLVVCFLQADGERAERQVAAGEWDCALVLPEDFQERLDRRDTYQLFTLLTGPGSTVYPMVRETAAACVAELISPDIAGDYLLDSGMADSSSIDGLRPRLDETLLDQQRVLVTLRTADGREMDPVALAESGTDGLLAGLAAIVLLVCAMFTAMDLGRWLDSPFARRTAPLRGEFALLLPRLAGALVPALVGSALALPALDEPGRYLPPLLPYLLFLGGLAMVLARWGPVRAALPVLTPFVPAAGLLLSPVLLDLPRLFPALTPAARWFPVTLYLRACGGRWQDGLALALMGGAALGALWGADLLRGLGRGEQGDK